MDPRIARIPGTFCVSARSAQSVDYYSYLRLRLLQTPRSNLLRYRSVEHSQEGAFKVESHSFRSTWHLVLPETNAWLYRFQRLSRFAGQR